MSHKSYGWVALIIAIVVVVVVSFGFYPKSNLNHVSPVENNTSTNNSFSGAVNLTYPIVSTGQTACYDNSTQIPCPSLGQPFYGQDAQYGGTPAEYTLEDNGSVVYDNVTGLYWMRGPSINGTANSSDKMTFQEAVSYVNEVNSIDYGGYNDWRLPTVKQLYSLYQASGSDPSTFVGSNTSVLTPFINTTYFNFAYGNTFSSQVMGSRIIDAQYFSNTIFVVNPAIGGQPQIFGVNFADGRIKGYFQAGANSEFTGYVMLTRGNPAYGENRFVKNGTGMVTDEATGLTWTSSDSGYAMTWEQALAYVQRANSENYLGYHDWRLPNIKELQSIVNYSNAPEYNGKPAIDTNFFTLTPITDENGNTDYGYYWSSTTHLNYISPDASGASEADYIAFGEALGWSNVTSDWIDWHGAGAQRSDPKTTPPYSFATVHTITKNGTTYIGYAHGPESDAVRGLNYVLMVRNN